MANEGKTLSIKEKAHQIIVSTVDLKRDYEVIGPVYYQISNKGILSSALSEKKTQYYKQISQMIEDGSISEARPDWGFLIGEWSVGQNDFEAAFFIATEEMKLRAYNMGADAIVGMRQDIDIDTNGFSFFYLQMYGTAVRFILTEEEIKLQEEEKEREKERRRQEIGLQSRQLVEQIMISNEREGEAASVFSKSQIERTENGDLICPKCGKKQKTNRSSCYFCGSLFKDN